MTIRFEEKVSMKTRNLACGPTPKSFQEQWIGIEIPFYWPFKPWKVFQSLMIKEFVGFIRRWASSSYRFYQLETGELRYDRKFVSLAFENDIVFL